MLGQPYGRYEIEKADFRDGRYYYGSIGDIAEGEERGWSESGSLLTVPTRLPHPQACIQRGRCRWPFAPRWRFAACMIEHMAHGEPRFEFGFEFGFDFRNAQFAVWV